MARAAKGTGKRVNPVSRQSKEKLSKELKAARARVRRAMKKYGGNYSGPSLESLRLDHVLNEIAGGKHINSIYARARGANAKNFQRAAAKAERRAIESMPDVYMYGGRIVNPTTYGLLEKAVNKANKNIIKALRDNPDYTGLLPAPLNVQDILDQVTTAKHLRSYITTINKAFTPKNLKVEGLDEDGTAGTKAEMKMLKFWVDIENEKRAEARAALQADFRERGVLRTVREYETDPVDTEGWNLDKWRRFTEQLTDAADMDRSGLWLQNYIKSLETTRGQLLSNRGYSYGDDAIKNIDELIKKAKAITDPAITRRLTWFSEDIEIMSNYFADADNVLEITEKILDAWADFEAAFL